MASPVINNVYVEPGKISENDFRKALGLPEQRDHLEDSLRYAVDSKPSGGILMQYTPILGNDEVYDRVMKKLSEDRAKAQIPYIYGGLPNIAAGKAQMNDIISGSITADKIAVGTIMTRKQEYKRDFDQNIWTIEVPGIEQDKIEVFQVKNVVYVRFNGEEHLQHLALDEKVETVRLELGILTIVIDRPDKRQDIPFS